MADEIEVETKDLQETIEEIHKEREEREEDERKNKWTRYIALTTAILAAFAAVAALESGGLANEGLMDQIKASDTWNQYQASRSKVHLYTIAATTLLDQKVQLGPEQDKKDIGKVPLSPVTPSQRLREFVDQVDRENDKQNESQKEAKKLQKEASEQLEKHHMFAYSVAMLQVAISLGAVSALTRIKSIWLVSSIIGLIGIVLFVLGFVK